MWVCTDKVKSPVVIRAQAKDGLEWNLFPGKNVRLRITHSLEITDFNVCSNHNGGNQRYHKNPGEGS